MDCYHKTAHGTARARTCCHSVFRLKTTFPKEKLYIAPCPCACRLHGQSIHAATQRWGWGWRCADRRVGGDA